MNRRLLRISLILGIALTASSALAAPTTINDPDAKISFTVPDGWNKDTSGGMLAFSTAAGDLTVKVLRVPVKDLKAAQKKLEGDLKANVQKMKKGKTKSTKSNGLTLTMTEGTGAIAGKPVKVAMVTVLTNTDKAFVIVGIVLTANAAAHKAELDAFMGGIKPIP